MHNRGKVEKKYLNNTNMRSYIKISEELRAELISHFNTTKMTIWRSCNYLQNSELGRRIRDYALGHGGVRMLESNYIPKCNIQHDSRGGWTQDFGNGVTVLFADRQAKICRGGQVVDTYSDITFETWGNILFEAQAMSDGSFERMIG